MSMPWFRFYVEMLHDPKVRRLDHKQKWLWVAVLGYACSSPQRDGRLYLALNEPVGESDLIESAQLSAAIVRTGLAKLKHLGLIHLEGEIIVVTKWRERQHQSDSSTERSRRSRQRSRSDDATLQQRPINGHATLPQRSRIGPDTETDTDKNLGRGTRLPEDWKPTELDVAWQRSEGLPDELAERELPKFVDHWLAKPGAAATKLDWSRAWKNWLRRAREWAPAEPKLTVAQRIAADNAWMQVQ